MKMKAKEIRSEVLLIRITPGFKKLLAEKRKDGFKISRYLEEKFLGDFYPTTEKLKKEIEVYKNRIVNCEEQIKKNKIDNLEGVGLEPVELNKLKIICDPKLSNSKQYELFRASVRTDMTFEQFIKLKSKYKNDIFG